jgi:hypothetical protein
MHHVRDSTIQRGLHCVPRRGGHDAGYPEYVSNIVFLEANFTLGKTADFGSMGDLVARVVFTNFTFWGVWGVYEDYVTRAGIFSLADLAVATGLVSGYCK